MSQHISLWRHSRLLPTVFLLLAVTVTVFGRSDQADIIYGWRSERKLFRTASFRDTEPVDLAGVVAHLESSSSLDLVPQPRNVVTSSGVFTYLNPYAELFLSVDHLSFTSDRCQSYSSHREVSLYVVIAEYSQIQKYKTVLWRYSKSEIESKLGPRRGSPNQMKFVGRLRCPMGHFVSSDTVNDTNHRYADLPFVYNVGVGWSASVRLNDAVRQQRLLGIAVFGFDIDDQSFVEMYFSYDLMLSYRAWFDSVQYSTDVADSAEARSSPTVSGETTRTLFDISPFIMISIILVALVTLAFTFSMTMRYYFHIRKWFFSGFYSSTGCFSRVVRALLCSRAVKLHRSDPSNSRFGTADDDIDDPVLLLSTTSSAAEWVERMEIQYGNLPTNDPVRKQVSARLEVMENRYRQLLNSDLRECAQAWKVQYENVVQEKELGQQLENIAHRRAEREAVRRRLEEEQALLRRHEEEEEALFARMEEQLRLRNPSASSAESSVLPSNTVVQIHVHPSSSSSTAVDMDSSAQGTST